MEIQVCNENGIMLTLSYIYPSYKRERERSSLLYMVNVQHTLVAFITISVIVWRIIIFSSFVRSNNNTTMYIFDVNNGNFINCNNAVQ